MHTDWKNELEKLEFVKEAIAIDLEGKINSEETIRKEMREINKDMWEQAGALSGQSTLEEAPTYLQGVMMLKQKMLTSDENKKRIYRLRKQLVSPYFCRIDYKEDDYILEKIYIGTYGLRIDETGEILIYDWRAPISGIFYDYEPGRVMYESPSGIINGELFLKRQYRIEKGHLIIMFDSNISIDDNILQDILAQSSNNKMKTIVSTIQREQNRAIRYEGKRIMVVQGPAGSGKTSIALHRAAYLLYRYKDNIKSENILLYTPNTAFIEYISSVLPELGEEELKCITLVNYAKKILGAKINKYESYSEMMEWKLANSNGQSNRFKTSKFKASKEFVDLLERFLELYEKEIISFEDIRNKDYIFMKKGEIEELFYETFKLMPVYKRLLRIKNIISIKIAEYEKVMRKNVSAELADDSQYISNSERNAVSRIKIKKDIKNTVDNIDELFSINIIDIYIKLFKESYKWGYFENLLSDKAVSDSLNSLENNILFYEDQAPILYLMVSLGMIDSDRNIKHIIIDEAQDYSVIAFKLFSKLYNDCNITILGDVNQNINSLHGIGSLELTGAIMDKENYEYIVLNKSYRSTLEIMNFASKILPANTVPYGRNGQEPAVIIKNNHQDLCQEIIEHIKNLEKKYNSIAVICRTLADCNILISYFADNINARLINSGDEEILAGINIMPSYLSKGMEFDVVIATILFENDYICNEDELFYTVCTRALHVLDIYALENTKILKKLL